jgi:hypothetical protein
MRRSDLAQQLIRFINAAISARELSEWAAGRIYDNNHSKPRMPLGEHDFLDEFLQACALATEPQMEFTAEKAREYLKQLAEVPEPHPDPAWASLIDAPVSQATRQAIQIEIHSLEGTGPDGLFEVARRCNALPVHRDMGGTLFVTPEGDVLVMGLDDSTPEVEHDPNWRLSARVSAAEKYPALGSLLPPRPVGIADCSACGGSGELQIGTVRLGCGYCWGLGWK